MKLRYLLLFPLVMFSCTNEVDEFQPEAEDKPVIDMPENTGRDTNSEEWKAFIQHLADSTLKARIEHFDRKYYTTLLAPEDFSNNLKLLTRWNGIEDISFTYEDMKLLLLTNNEYDNFGIVNGTSEYRRYLYYQRYTTQKVDSVIQMEINKGVSPHWDRKFICAGTRKGAYICADKPLFGRKAGEPLNDKFSVTSDNEGTWIRASYPDFNIIANGYEEELPTAFDEVFKAGTALYPGNEVIYGLVLSFNEIPTEKYSRIKFTVCIPIEGEYFSERFGQPDYDEYYYQIGRVLPNKDRVLKGSVMVKFK